jgi:hypothetical protein
MRVATSYGQLALLKTYHSFDWREEAKQERRAIPWEAEIAFEI